MDDLSEFRGIICVVYLNGFEGECGWIWRWKFV